MIAFCRLYSDRESLEMSDGPLWRLVRNEKDTDSFGESRAIRQTISSYSSISMQQA